MSLILCYQRNGLTYFFIDALWRALKNVTFFFVRFFCFVTSRLHPGARLACCSRGARQNVSAEWVKSRAVNWKSANTRVASRYIYCMPHVKHAPACIYNSGLLLLYIETFPCWFIIGYASTRSGKEKGIVL